MSSAETPKRDASQIKYSIMTAADVDEVTQFLGKEFFPREPISRGLHVTLEMTARLVEPLMQDCLESGVSFIARDPEGKVIGCRLSKFLTRENKSILSDISDDMAEKLHTLLAVMFHLESSADHFADADVNKILRFILVCVAEDWTRLGIAGKLVQMSEDKGRDMGAQLIAVDASNIYTQKLFTRRGYKTSSTMIYKDFEVNGVKIFDLEAMGESKETHVMSLKLV